MFGQDVEFFIDELDNGFNEIVISETDFEFEEPAIDFVVESTHEYESDVTRSPFLDSDCSEITLAMTESDLECWNLLPEKQKKIENRSIGKVKTTRKKSKDKFKEKWEEKSMETFKKSIGKFKERSIEKFKERSKDKSKEKWEIKVKEKSRKSDEKFKDKSIVKSKEKFEEKIKEKSEEKIKEKSEEKIKEKSEEKIKEKSEEKIKEKSEEKIKEKSEEKVKEKSEEKVKEKSEEKIKEKSEEKINEKSAEKVKEKLEEKVKEKSAEKVKEKSTEKVQEESEEKIKEKSAGKVKEKSAEKINEKSKKSEEKPTKKWNEKSKITEKSDEKIVKKEEKDKEFGEPKRKKSKSTFRDISNENSISLRPRESLVKREATVTSKDPGKRDPVKKEPENTRKRKHSTDVVAQVIPPEFYIGRLLWAKVKCHPWWPCMIFYSPDHIFYRNKYVHVAYFGPYVERGWVSVRDILPYDGKDKFDEHVRELQKNNAPKAVIHQFNVPPLRLRVYNDAVEEAEEAKLLSLEDRIKLHGITYRNFDSCLSESSSSEEEKEEAEENAVKNKEKTVKPRKSSTLQSKSVSQTDSSKKPKLPNNNEENSIFQFEFERLKVPLFATSKHIHFCFLCLEEGELVTETETEPTKRHLVNCAGYCAKQFHLECIKKLFDFLTSRDVTTRDIDYTKCVDCSRGVQRCFVCHKIGKSDQKKDEMMKCASSSCRRYYHSRCLYNGPYQQMITYSRSGSLLCPSHTCHACHIEDPAAVKHSTRYSRCLMCPAAFHNGEWCIPAGSVQIDSNHIICPQHLPMGGCAEISLAPFINCIKNGVVTLKSINFKITSFNDKKNKDLWLLEKPIKAQKSKPHNVTWCFLCSKDGSLICCEKCPASFHEDCANLDKIPDAFICEECQLGKYPRYGEICWLKIGHYRWWPGQIIHPRNAPQKVMKASQKEGQFIVQFFGSNDYYWMNKTHVFPFEEGDELTEIKKIGESSSSEETCDEQVEELVGGKRLELDFQKSLKIAAKAVIKRQNKFNSIFDIRKKPSRYRSIKSNIPVGNVRINKIADLSEVPQCECRPNNPKNDSDPCGRNSNCDNRSLMYECHPKVCRNGDKCRNQRFMKREYPKQEVFLTENCGWALKTLEPLKKGDFVNEYVGEIIDVTEAERRLKKAHESNISNFYMMELDGSRVIDAGPAANLSRFMNHSCSPNVYTEKWTVNGDTRIGLFALQNIAAGEELTFNYNFFSLGKNKIECKCGASNCSGFLGVPPKVAPISDTITNPDKDTNSETKKSQPSQKNPVSINRKSTITVDTPKTSKPIDEECFRCGLSDCDVICSYQHCPRVYHARCIDNQQITNNKWLCPWHYCDECGRLSEAHCSQCSSSYCNIHLFDRILKVTDEYYLCSSHEEMFLSHGSPSESQTGSTNATFSITGTDSLPSVSI